MSYLYGKYCKSWPSFSLVETLYLTQMLIYCHLLLLWAYSMVNGPLVEETM